ncbi:hypothetical protein [Sneathiella glossodoripedis]|uniref:hypothetical protein n=1 Tax=Sneathiella glossodoripedis TaxID=418853 RepID=UPI000470CE3B|nr:hypothetical protein [Sneathiella glossodoripedis]
MKVTTWNAEWLEIYWGVVSGKYTSGQNVGLKKAPSLAVGKKRLDAAKLLVTKMNPDILFLCEGPKGNLHMQKLVDQHFPSYELIRHDADHQYAVNGIQWLWFLVKKNLADKISPRLLSVNVWQNFAARSSETIKDDGRWNISIPRLKDFGDVKDVPVSTRDEHSYYRHPQTLVFEVAGARHEIIGAHLKSKFTGSSPRKRKAEEDFEDYSKVKSVQKYLAKAHAARVKLSSEASNIRAYIDQRFQQESDPSIIVLGDLNDGPGKELLEREYLLHDLISNLQGDVFLARQFLNHALFDYPQHLRWTCVFEDKIDPARSPHILLDHILFTQAFTHGGTGSLAAKSGAGKVEHLAFEEVESAFGKGAAGDHRPVSLNLSPRDHF